MTKAKSLTTSDTAIIEPSEYDLAMVAFKSAEQHLAGLRQRRTEAEQNAADLNQKARDATEARRQAVVDGDMTSAAKHGSEATSATAAAADAAEIVAAMNTAIQDADAALIAAEDALNFERRNILAAHADRLKAELLADLRVRALEYYRAAFGGGVVLSDYARFLRGLASDLFSDAFGNEADAKLNLPVPAFPIRSDLIDIRRRVELGQWLGG